MKFEDSVIELPAYLIPMVFIILMMMIIITPWFLLIAIPIILTFIGGIITENISLDYDINLVQNISKEEE